VMTGDLYLLSEVEQKEKVSTEAFIKHVKATLDRMLEEGK